MAEGGSLQEKKCSNDNASSISPCRLLDCPICLEQMQQPKSLPCLHSFCEECLGTYIVTDLSGEMAAATSFPCPVCRRITSPVDPSESNETWARQFPANSLDQCISSNTKMKSDSSLCCSICKKRRDIQTPAKHLCKSDCLLFCELCKTEIHDLLHKECDIVAVHDVTWNHPLSQTCSTHNEKMEWYCQDHKVIGCSKCIFTAHRRCDAVMTVNEYCKKQTENSSLDDMDKFLGMAFNCMERLTEACDVQDTSMQQNKDASLKSILDLRQQINIGLDKKQEELTQELISKHKAEKAKVDVSRQRCNRLKAAIKNTRDAAGTAAQRGDPVKMIQLFHHGQTEIEACNNLRDEIATSATTIKHDISRLHSMSIGRILVEVKPCVMSSEIEHVQTKKQLYDSGVKKLVTINIQTSSDREDCDVRGVVMMANQTLVISDYNNRNLKLFSQHGECLNVLKILGKPQDICLVDNSTVAVAVADDTMDIQLVMNAVYISRW